MSDMYRLKYKDKWMKVIRMTGTYIYKLFDDPNEVEPTSLNKAQAGRTLVCADNNLEIEDIEIVKV